MKSSQHSQPKTTSVSSTPSQSGLLQRRETNNTQPSEVPPIVHEVLRSPGQPLESDTRTFMQSRFGQDFSQVRVHTNTQAADSAQAIEALAYTVNQDIVFNAGQYSPHSTQGRQLLAHELTHVVQRGKSRSDHAMAMSQTTSAVTISAAESPYEQEADAIAARIVNSDATLAARDLRHPVPSGMLLPYRSKEAFNFGRKNTPTLKEETFTDAKKQPWIEQITVNYTGSKIDSNKDLAPTGTLEAVYNKNAAALPNIKRSILGGATVHGLTNQGDFTVNRIEGIGYNDLPLSKAKGAGPSLKYSKSLSASMHYAVFFHRGQAIHIGSLTVGSHACVHAGDSASDFDKMQQINYHSVVGRTKVKVLYASSPLALLCCSRMKVLGITKKGKAENPCQGADPKSCVP